MRELADRGTVLDVCPISNLRTRAVASLDEHPLPRARRRGRALLDLDRRPGDVRHRPHPRLRGGCRLGLDPQDFYEAGVEGALCDAETKNRLEAIGASFESGRLPFSRNADTLRVTWPEERHRHSASARRRHEPEAKAEGAPSWEDQLLLAAAPAREGDLRLARARVRAGFVLLGVGSGSDGIGDLLSKLFGGEQGSSTSSQIRASSRRSPAHPREHHALSRPRRGSTSISRTGREPRDARGRAKVEPKNTDVLHRLAGIYSGHAEQRATRRRTPRPSSRSEPVTPRAWTTTPSSGRRSPRTLTARRSGTRRRGVLEDGHRVLEVGGAYKRVATVAKGTSQEPNAQLQLARRGLQVGPAIRSPR